MLRALHMYSIMQPGSRHHCRSRQSPTPELLPARFCACRVPEAVSRVSSRLEAVLQLLAGLFGAMHVQASVSGRLLRVACQALTVQCLPSLHVKAVGESDQQRKTIVIHRLMTQS